MYCKLQCSCMQILCKVVSRGCNNASYFLINAIIVHKYVLKCPIYVLLVYYLHMQNRIYSTTSVHQFYYRLNQAHASKNCLRFHKIIIEIRKYLMKNV